MMVPSCLVEVSGNIPVPRFGLTVTQITPTKVAIFGGATGSSGNFAFTNDTYTFEVQKRQWRKVQTNGTLPSPRAAHATVAIDANQLMVYGGAAGGNGSMADNGLYFLRLQESIGQWKTIEVNGSNPGKRYGHTLTFAKPNLILFGGHTETHESNECWVMNIQSIPMTWAHITPKGTLPSPRVYHSASFCSAGTAQGMILIFGGRADKKAQCDLWGLTRHRDGSWSWQEAPAKESETLTGRYQHSSHCVGTSFIVAGGRTNLNDSNLTLDVFDMQTNKWSCFPTVVQRFRHGSWICDNSLYMYAGFQKEAPTISTDIIEKTKLQFRSKAKLPEYFVDYLLQPQNYRTCEGMKFIFKPNEIRALCDTVQKIIMEQQMVLRVKAPVQVFGDIHGQYSDLMSFFALYGTPYANGKPKDIDNYDYVFLGDYVDRGSHSLQTICLLFALKCMFPKQIHLIRGNHEDIQTNESFGFAEECELKCDEDAMSQGSVFKRINQVFDRLPLAAVIQDKILCLHGGIGSKLNKVQQINAIQRPVHIVHQPVTEEDQLVLDILWSDPTQNDDIAGVHPNPPRDPEGLGNIVKFGPDVVRRFLKDNDLSLIIRAHECVMDGFQRFAGGQLITVFSATDYCRRHKNSGAMLTIKTNLQIIPKLIHPSPQNANNWIEDELARPCTPPRWRSTNLRN